MTTPNLSHFYGYIRVSTARQGEKGVSLQEQRDAIERYASRNQLTISAWFEERETAAKRGRPVFTKMLQLLQRGKAQGLIVHKIDRSARNLKDWADLGELIDHGVKVHFANESLDLNSRGGRLSADIQAVVAADYIRNLREETRKGFYGRIKQGFYPLRAPLGYLDMGKAKAKTIDPAKGLLVKKAFELYATGKYKLETLNEELYRLGLRNTKGGRVSRAGLSILLNNPFYIGLIRLRRTKETFPGLHQPLITKSVFDQVQRVLKGKLNARTQRHDFLFRRIIRCQHCNYSLIGETRKGYVYYRCHTPTCPTTCIREERIEETTIGLLRTLQFNEEERRYLKERISRLGEEWAEDRKTQEHMLETSKTQLKARLGRLTDALIDGLVDKATYEDRKTAVLLDITGIEDKLQGLTGSKSITKDRLDNFLGLASNAYLTYKMGFNEEKRDLLRIVTSDIVANGKTLHFTLALPFNEIARRARDSKCAPCLTTPRTIDRLLERLIAFFHVHPWPTRHSS